MRPIFWRGVPLHYAIPVAITLVGLLLLLVGGVAAFFGGWWLATALPIAIGGLFRDPRLCAVPAAVWALWLVIGAIAGPDASLANTPVFLALGLAVLGAGATYLAQRAVFPATDPETVEAARRTVPTMDDAPAELPVIEPLPVDEAEDVDPVLVEAFEVDADAADDEAEPAQEAEPELEAEAEGESEGAPEAESETEPEADPEPEAEAAVAPEDDAPAPDPLDEGGHVEEFAAITEADLAASADDAPLPAATRAGQKDSGS